MRSSSREPSGFRREIERVVHFAGRMTLGKIQFGEVVVVGFDVGPFGDRKSHVGENRRQFIGHLTDRMDTAALCRPSRTGSVTSTVSVLSCASSAAALSAFFASCDRFGDAVLEAVDRRTLCLALVGDIVPSVFEQRRDRAASSERGDRERLRAPLHPLPRRRSPEFPLQALRCQTWLITLSCAGPIRASRLRWPATLTPKPLRRQRGLGLFDDRLECSRFADCEIGQHLAVDRHAGLGQPGDKPAVVQAERAHRRVQALDPQARNVRLRRLRSRKAY